MEEKYILKQDKLIRIRRLKINDEDSQHTFVMEQIDRKTLARLKKDAESINDKNVKQKYMDALNANKQYHKSKILTRENEIIRIVSAINEENTKMNGKYPFVKDLIVVSFGKSANKYGKLAQRDNPKDIGVITIKNVLDDKTMRYKNLLCSSSNVRTSKAMFVREDLFDIVNKILLCGIPHNYPFEVFAKFNSYYGLPNTDSIPVSMPNIVVIPDYINSIRENFDIVTGDVTKEIIAKVGKKQKDKVIGQGEYTVTENQSCDFKMLPFDGAGLVDISRMQKWQKELALDYIPSAVQFRAIPGIKGNLYTFDLKKFAEQLKKQGKPTSIIDYWGKKWDLERDNINCIMTRSQFKFADIYKNLANKAGTPTEGFKIWYDEFTKPVKIGKNKYYKRTFNLSEISEPYDALKDECVISYQPLQTLRFTSKEIRLLCENTVNKVETVHSSLDDFLRFRGLTDKDNNNGVPPYYKALKANSALYYDPYIRSQIENDLKTLKHRCYSGRLFLNGNYQTFTPDIYALAQAAFGLSVTGILKARQIYSKYWCNHKINEIDIIRFPHIAKEHFVANVVDPKSDWYKYQDTGLVSSIWDSLAMRLNSADYDGDHVLSIYNKQLIDGAKRANINTILWNRLDDKKDEKDKDKDVFVPINDTKKIIDTNVLGMKNDIGKVINFISILWSMPPTEEVQKAIKVMSIIGSLTIDYAKSGEKAEIPPDIKNLLKDQKKPMWMKYLRKSDIYDDTVIESNLDTYVIDDASVDDNKRSKFECRKDCTMQQICDYMQSQIDQIKMNFDAVTELVSTEKIKEKYMLKFIKGNVYNNSIRYEKIKTTLKELQDDYRIISKEVFKNIKTGNKEDSNIRYKVFFEYCRDTLLDVCNNVKEGDGKLETLIDYLIYIYYTEPEFENTNNAILWNAFENELLKRCLSENITDTVDVAKIQKRLKRRKEKVKKMKQNSYLVNIKQFDNMSDIIITISDNEISNVKQKIQDDRDCRLYLVLLGLYRKNNNEPFAIGSYSKFKINQSQICKLARFDKDARQYKKCIKNLLTQELITADFKNLKQPTITVNTNLFDNDTPDGVTHEFVDVNNYAQYLETALIN